jgi:hypothetical protein
MPWGGGIKVGNGTDAHAEIRRWWPADFAQVGLMTTRPEKGADPAFAGRAGAATVTPCRITPV